MAEDKEEKAQPQRQVLPPNATVADLRRALAGVDDEPLGPGMATDPESPGEHYFLATDGRKINAFGEEKGSAEDKKRWP